MKKILTATIIALSFPVALFAAGTTTEMAKPTKAMDSHMSDTAKVKKAENMEKKAVKKATKKAEKKMVKKAEKSEMETVKSDTKIIKGTASH
jgi:hypothetical protein